MLPAVRRRDRVACIAGKPAPTGLAVLTKTGGCRAPLWERACSRWHPCGAPARPRCLHRRQANSHRFGGAHKNRGLPRPSVGAGLLAMASLRCARRTGLLASQASQLPQVWRCSQKPEAAAHLCGSGLARDGIPAVRRRDRVACIAGKPAPTVFAVLTKSGVCRVPLWERACSRWRPCGAPGGPRCLHRRQASSHRFGGAHKNRRLPRTSVGAGLLAMASLRCASQTGLLASQASQLPQVLRCSPKSHDISRQTMPAVVGPVLTSL